MNVGGLRRVGSAKLPLGSSHTATRHILGATKADTDMNMNMDTDTDTTQRNAST